MGRRRQAALHLRQGQARRSDRRRQGRRLARDQGRGITRTGAPRAYPNLWGVPGCEPGTPHFIAAYLTLGPISATAWEGNLRRAHGRVPTLYRQQVLFFLVAAAL